MDGKREIIHNRNVKGLNDIFNNWNLSLIGNWNDWVVEKFQKGMDGKQMLALNSQKKNDALGVSKLYFSANYNRNSKLLANRSDKWAGNVI